MPDVAYLSKLEWHGTPTCDANLFLLVNFNIFVIAIVTIMAKLDIRPNLCKHFVCSRQLFSVVLARLASRF